ncbi:MAG TPA: DUF6682 family protein [Sphingobacteriaceae bacterium]
MNVQDVVTRVKRTFGDEAAVQITNEDIMRWINDAQTEIVTHNDAALQKTDTIDLVAGTSQYTPPVDLLLIRSLRFKYDSMQSYSVLRYKSIQQFDEEIDGWDGTAYNQARPYFFTINDGNIVIFPTPDESATDGLKVVYNQKPTDVTSLADSLALPLVYHPTIVRYCLWQASLLDEDHEPGVMYRNEFMTDMDRLSNSETKDPVATYPVITVLESDL